MTTMIGPVPTAATPLGEARDWLRDRAMDKGANCPCCGQLAKVYRVKLGAAIAWPLVAMYRGAGNGWVHVPSLGAQSGDPLKARHWGLIVKLPDAVREDSNPRTGWWRLTALGVQFVREQVEVTKYVRLYDSRCLGFSGTETVGIREALATKFDYDELMAGR